MSETKNAPLQVGKVVKELANPGIRADSADARQGSIRITAIDMKGAVVNEAARLTGQLIKAEIPGPANAFELDEVRVEGCWTSYCPDNWEAEM